MEDAIRFYMKTCKSCGIFFRVDENILNTDTCSTCRGLLHEIRIGGE